MSLVFTGDYDSSKCIALIKKNNTIQQCSRNHTKECFCLTHLKNKEKLVYGYINIEKKDEVEENEKEENQVAYYEKLIYEQTLDKPDIRNLNFKKKDIIQFEGSDKKYSVNWITGETKENNFSSLVSKQSTIFETSTTNLIVHTEFH